MPLYKIFVYYDKHIKYTMCIVPHTCLYCCYMVLFNGLVILEICRGQPPDSILRKAKNTSKFFKFVGSIKHEESGQIPTSSSRMYQVLAEEEYEAVSTSLKL